jgi:hypothetical protein
MATSDYFSGTYQEAREKFLLTASGRQTKNVTYVLSGYLGPKDEELSIDVAMLNIENASKLLILISGTHGVEGFCGPGCQVGFLNDQLFDAFPDDTGFLLIHGLNPFGFAWLRRTNEENIDLNRNFQDFSKPVPRSEAYAEIHEWLVPQEWEGSGRMHAEEQLGKYKDKGMTAFQAAVSAGQYEYADGLFYGGMRQSWSNGIIKRIIAELIPAGVRRIAVFDFHTGLGPRGYGEPIYLGDSGGLERAKNWFSGKGIQSHSVSFGPHPQPGQRKKLICGLRRLFLCGSARDGLRLTRKPVQTRCAWPHSGQRIRPKPVLSLP